MYNSNRTLSRFGRTTLDRLTRLTKVFLMLICVLLLSQRMQAQITGTKNIPGDYATLAAAITDLNTQGVGSGGVTLNLIAGNPETAPAGGYIIGGAGSAVLTSSSAANPIVIEGNGNTITAGAQAANTLNDAVFALVGADWVTIQNFTVQENGANTVTAVATNTMTEWAFALLHVSATDGAQNNTIKGNTISLTRTYQNSFAVYSNVRHSLAAPTTLEDITNNTTAPNSGNKVYGNTVSNVTVPFLFVGSATSGNMDVGNDIGGSSALTGNTVTNYANLPTASAYPGVPLTVVVGTYMMNQQAYNVSYNSLTTASLTSASGIRAILADYVTVLPTGTFSNNITNNTLTVTQAGAGGVQVVTTQSTAGVASGVTLNINNNSVINCAITNAVTLFCLANLGAYGNLNINGNTIRGNTSTAANNGFVGITHQVGLIPGTISIQNNNIGTGSGSNGAFQSTVAASSTGQSFAGITVTAATTTTNVNISGNTLQGFQSVTLPTGTGTGMVGIQLSNTSGAPGGSININNNNFGTASVPLLTVTNAATSAVTGITCSSGLATATLSISGNIYRGITYNTLSTSANTYISNTAATLSQNISNNQFLSMNINSSGNVTFITNSVSLTAAGSKTINNNTVNGYTRTGASGTVTFFTTGSFSVNGSTNTITGNSVSNVSLAGTSVFNGILNSEGNTATDAPTKNISNNTFTNISGGSGAVTLLSASFGGATTTISGNSMTSISGTGNITGITLGSSNNTVNCTQNTLTGFSSTGASGNVTGIAAGGTSAVTTVNITQNTIGGFSCSGTTSPIIAGISATFGTTVTIARNKIYDLSVSGAIATTAGAVRGISLGGGTTVNVYNNLIGDLRAPAANLLDVIRGISVTSTTASTSYQLFYNTVYINASSTGAAFGTTGIFHTASATATTASLLMRNNIVVNLSTPGTTGVTSALFRSTAATLGNYNAASDRNLFYAGSPDATHAILNDNGTVYSTFGPAATAGTFQNFVATREANSFSGEAGFTYSTAGSFFQSLTGTDPNFLHLVAGITTQAESGGLPVTSPAITDDYDGNARSGTNPDVGADEFVGVTPAPSITLNSVTPPVTPALCVATARLVSVNITTPGGTITGATLNYAYNGSAQTPIALTNTTGTTWEATIPAPTSPSNATVTWSVSATNSLGLSSLLPGTSYADEPLAAYVANASSNNSTVCAGSPANLSVILQLASAPAAPAASSYCASTHTSGCSGDNIQRVVLNTLDKTTGTTCGTTSLAYSNFSGLTGSNTTTLNGGNNYTLSITFGSDVNQYAGAWIDFNHDGVYSAAEFLGASGNGGANGTVGLSFTVPVTAFNGLTHMRVIGGNDAAVTSTQACGASSSTWGETQDYDVTITGASQYGGSITAYSWSDGTNTVGTTANITVNPTSTTTYTATLTAAGCNISSNAVTINTTALPTAPSTAPSTQCGSGVPEVFAAGGSPGNYRWYLTPTGGTAIPGETNAGLSLLNSGTGTYSISTTTTFYVSIFDGVCESLRTPAVATVNTPVTIDVSGSTSGSVCLNQSVTLAVTSAAPYTYVWTANPGAGSGISGSLAGSAPTTSSNSVTPTVAGTYTYTVTATDVSGPSPCVATANVTIVVNPLPVITTATASPSTVCEGAPVTLSMTSNVITTGPTSLPGTYCVPSQLGTSNVTNVSFNTLSNTDVVQSGTFYNIYPATGATTTTVDRGQTYALTLSTDAASIVSVWIDFNRNGTFDATEWFQPWTAGATGSINITIPAGASLGATGMRIRSRAAGNANLSTDACSSFGSGSTHDYTITIRDFVLNNPGYTYVWNPGAITGPTATVNPTSTTTYTAVVTNTATGCVNTQDVTVTVNPLPPAPTGNSSEQCGSGTPTATVSSNSGAGTPSFNWYTVPTGGSTVQTGTSTSYNSIVSTTTTFYVSEVSAAGCEGPRGAVTVTVSEPDPVNIVASSTSICLGETINLNANYTPDLNTYTFTWSATPTTGAGLPGDLTTQAIVVTPTVAGTYTYFVTAFDADKNCSTIAQVTVTVKPVPTNLTAASNNASVCTGGSVNLSSSAFSNTFTTTTTTEGFETFPPSGWTFINAGTSPNQWASLNNTQFTGAAHTGNAAMYYNWDASNNANAWAITPAQSLVAGQTYTVSFWYLTASVGGVFPEKLKVTVGTANNVAAQTTVLWNNNGGANLINETYAQGTINFVAPSTGTYYFGFNCYSDADNNFMIVDDISISGQTPLPVTYSWSSSPSGFSSTLQNPTNVTVSATTTYSVTFTNSVGCSAGPANVTVTAIPLPNAPVATNSSHCGLQVPTASVSSGGANGTFRWYDAPTGGTLLQTGGSTYATAISTTTTFYVAEFDGTCESPRTAVTVTVTDPTAISVAGSGPAAICLNSSATLAVTSTAPYTYVWTASPGTGSGISGSLPGSASGTSSNTITPTVAGTYVYTVTGTDNSGPNVCVATATFTLTVNPNPIVDSIKATPATICVGGTSSLSVYSSAPATGPQTLPGTYCVPIQTGTALITGVTFGSISNTGVNQVSPFYDIYPNTTTVNAGQTLSLGVTTGSASIVSAWIDYNRNGLFDATEWVQVWTAASTGSINITIPANATPGLTGLRIRSRASGNTNGSGDACTTFGSGSTHDYSINIVGLNTQNPDFTYTWNPGGLTGSTVSVTPTSTTSYTVTINNPATGCSTVSNPVTVNVTPVGATASASPATAVCAGSTVTLSAGATGGAPFTYQWNDGTSNFSTAASPVVNPLVTTTYTVTVTDACLNQTTSSVTVNVNPLPSASISNSGANTICAPATHLLTVTTDAASPSYQWTLNGSNISGANASTLTVSTVGAGSYSVVVTDGVTGCIRTATPIALTINPQPAAISFTPSAATICNGSSQSITASSAFGSASATSNSGTISVAIPDVSSAGTSSTLAVSGVPFGATIDSVIVQFSVTHSFVQDLILNLEAPNGQILNLVSGVNVTTGANFTNTRISSDNTKPAMPTTGVPFTATYRADGLLTGFQLAPLPSPTTSSFANLFGTGNGTWRLRVYDDESIGTGTLTNWNIKVSYTNPAPTWSWTPATGLDVTNAATVTASPSATTTYTATATNNLGCTTSNQVTVTVNPRPTAVLSGSAAYCQNQPASTNLSIAFTGTGPWTYTLNGSDASSVTATTSSNPVTVTVNPNSATPALITYTVSALSDANCAAIGADLTGSGTVTINPLAAAPTANVTQPTCAVATGSITMTAPLGAGNSYTLDGTTTITWPSITFSGVAPGPHTITVTNSFGCSAPASASVTVNPQPIIPATPVVAGPTNICPFLGNGTQITYTATANGATSFNWILPPNVNLISGAGTGTIVVTFNAAFGTQANKQIRVTASSICGTSSQTIYYLLAQFPSTPAPIVASTLDVCSVIGTSNTITFTIPKVAGASSYIWTSQAGTTVVSHPNGLGANDTTITVSFSNAFTTSAITVTAVNDCGTSGTRSITLTRANPSTPSPISGPTNVCGFISPGTATATYTVPAQANASSYTWTLPVGATNVTGQGTNTISFTYPAGYTGGTISVIASNGCGNSPLPRSLTVSVLSPATPSVIDVINTAPCPDRVYTYSVASMPANATSLNWTIPAAGTIVSGQGTTSITVSYPGTAVNGSVTVAAVNNCGSSVVRSVDVKLPACPPPAFTSTSNAPSKGTSVAPQAAELDVTVFPNPTVSDFKLQVQTASKEIIHVRVLDITGREYKVFQLVPGSTLSLGRELKAGSYILEVRQGKSLKTTKVLKF